MNTKICIKCKKTKNIEEFNQKSKGSATRKSYCKECQSEYNKQYRSKHLDKANAVKRQYYKDNIEKERLRNKNYHKRYPYRFYKKCYGITIEQKKEMILKQNYKCLSCGTDLKLLKDKKVHIDHDHTTNKIRGILCSNCNTALGLLNENFDNAIKLSEYIRKFCNGEEKDEFCTKGNSII